jgi:hypothetical protein
MKKIITLLRVSSAASSMVNSPPRRRSRIPLMLACACAIFVSRAEIQASPHTAGGHLIVQRVPNFGTDLVVHLSIDGKKTADIPRDQHYEGFISPGHHVLTVVAMPNTERLPPTTTRLNVQSGRTYIYTATWTSDRGVVLRRSSKSNDTYAVPAVKTGG